MLKCVLSCSPARPDFVPCHVSTCFLKDKQSLAIPRLLASLSDLKQAPMLSPFYCTKISSELRKCLVGWSRRRRCPRRKIVALSLSKCCSDPTSTVSLSRPGKAFFFLPPSFLIAPQYCCPEERSETLTTPFIALSATPIYFLGGGGSRVLFFLFAASNSKKKIQIHADEDKNWARLEFLNRLMWFFRKSFGQGAELRM